MTDLLRDTSLPAVVEKKLREYEQNYSRFEAENVRLKEENRELKTKLAGLTSEDEISEDEEKILVLLSKVQGPLADHIISSELGLNPTKAKFYLERMWTKDYVHSQDWTDERPSEYYLIQKGREYLIKNNLVE